MRQGEGRGGRENFDSVEKKSKGEQVKKGPLQLRLKEIPDPSRGKSFGGGGCYRKTYWAQAKEGKERIILKYRGKRGSQTGKRALAGGVVRRVDSVQQGGERSCYDYDFLILVSGIFA